MGKYSRNNATDYEKIYDDFNNKFSQYDWDNLLLNSGYQLKNDNSKFRYYTRPGKDIKDGPSVVLCKDVNRVKVFSTNADGLSDYASSAAVKSAVPPSIAIAKLMFNDDKKEAFKYIISIVDPSGTKKYSVSQYDNIRKDSAKTERQIEEAIYQKELLNLVQKMYDESKDLITIDEIPVTINTTLINKQTPGFNGWSGCVCSLQELMVEVGKGYTFCPALFKNNVRSAVNAYCFTLYAIDIDNEIKKGVKCSDNDYTSIYAALDNKEMMSDAVMLYETYSNKPDHNKFRIIYNTNKVFLIADGPGTMEQAALQKLYKMFCESKANLFPNFDKTKITIDNLFYGNSEGKFYLPMDKKWYKLKDGCIIEKGRYA